MLSWPTGGGHGRSLITLISTACAARGEVEGKRWRGKKMEGKERTATKGKRDKEVASIEEAEGKEKR